MRVVYVGFLKTASRSICKFCKELLNYDAYQGNKANLHESDTDIIFDDFVIDGDDMRSCFHDGNVKNKDIYDFLDKHDNLITKEFPYFGMYEYIHNKYEDTKFILCIRDPDEAFKSYMEFMNAYRPRQAYKIHRALLDLDRAIGEGDRVRFKKVYMEHNGKIIEFFKDKPGKLLVFDFKDIKSGIFEEKISSFLGKENTNGLKLDNLKSRSA